MIRAYSSGYAKLQIWRFGDEVSSKVSLRGRLNVEFFVVELLTRVEWRGDENVGSDQMFLERTVGTFFVARNLTEDALIGTNWGIEASLYSQRAHDPSL